MVYALNVEDDTFGSLESESLVRHGKREYTDKVLLPDADSKGRIENGRPCDGAALNFLRSALCDGLQMQSAFHLQCRL